LSPALRAIAVVVAATTLTAVVAVGGFLAFLAWDDHQFKNGPYCHAEPDDPLC
jgi:hypothetical protein